MRRSTAIMAMYEPEAKTGENLHWERAKEGYFSIREDLGLQFHGATAQETLTGKNLCLNFAKRSVSIRDAAENKYQFDGKSFYPGATMDNYYIQDLVEYACDGDTITVISHMGGYGVGIDMRVKSSTTYTISAMRSGAFENRYRIGFYASDGTFIGYTSTSNGTFVTPENCEWVLYVITSTNNAECVCTNIQLEQGDTATTYEPYCGGIPAPNPGYPIPIQCVKAGTRVQVCGKNLIDLSTVSSLTTYGVTFTVDASAGTVTANGTATEQASITLLNRSYYDNNLFLSGADSNAGDGRYRLTAIRYRGNGNANDYEQGTIVDIDNTDGIAIWAVVSKGATVENVVFRPFAMLTTKAVASELTTQDKKYQPYISGGEIVTPLRPLRG